MRGKITPADYGKVYSYHLLGMEDLFLDFAGRKAERHPARRALQQLTAGSRLRMQARGEHLELINDQGLALARLSKKAEEIWAGRLPRVREVRVVAMVRRQREEVAEPAFQAACRGERWQVPIVEVVYGAAEAE